MDVSLTKKQVRLQANEQATCAINSPYTSVDKLDHKEILLI